MKHLQIFSMAMQSRVVIVYNYPCRVLRGRGEGIYFFCWNYTLIVVCKIRLTLLENKLPRCHRTCRGNIKTNRNNHETTSHIMDGERGRHSHSCDNDPWTSSRGPLHSMVTHVSSLPRQSGCRKVWPKNYQNESKQPSSNQHLQRERGHLSCDNHAFSVGTCLYNYMYVVITVKAEGWHFFRLDTVIDPTALCIAEGLVVAQPRYVGDMWSNR